MINKERSSGFYRLSAYYMAKTVSELPLVLFSADCVHVNHLLDDRTQCQFGFSYYAVFSVNINADCTGRPCQTLQPIPIFTRSHWLKQINL